MEKIEIGFIGLGRMGGNMVSRMLKNKNVNVNIYNRTEEVMEKFVAKGAIKHLSIKNLVSKLLQERKIVWMMLPSGEVTENIFQELLNLLKKTNLYS